MCFGHLFRPASFRRFALREQLAWAVALSFGPGVLLVVAAAWLAGVTAGAALLFLSAALALWLAYRHPPRRDITRKAAVLALLVFAAWAAVVLVSLVEIGVGDRLWMSVTTYDHGLRTAFVDAVLRTGVPPVDPVYWPGHDTPARYYYFWYVVCAAVARLAHISGRQALIASCVWPPAGVVAMLALFARHVLGRRGRELTRLLLTASALLGVAGLDLLVTIALYLLGTPVFGDMEWWSIDQVSSWPDTFLWVPHHAASLVAALLGLLLLLRAATAHARSRFGLAAVAGLSFASAFGMSAYVAIAVAAVAAGWLLSTLRSPVRTAALQSLLFAGAVSAVTLSGFLRQLLHHEGANRTSAAPLSFGFREILDPGMLTGWPIFRADTHPWRAREFAAAILLLPGWCVELGFFAAVLLAMLFRRRRSSPGERTLLWLTLSGLVAASVLRSGVIVTNDYGIRAALLPQFFLLLLGALVFASSAGKFRRFLWLLALIGAGGCAYQLVLLRSYLPWWQAHRSSELSEVGERTYALREAYTTLQGSVPAGARIQYDPAETSFFQYPHLLYGNRQLITAEGTCSTSFGGDPAACPAIQRALQELFPALAPVTPDSARAQTLCASLGAQYLIATRWDQAWAASSGWVWTLPAAVSQPSVRVLRCAG